MSITLSQITAQVLGGAQTTLWSGFDAGAQTVDIGGGSLQLPMDAAVQFGSITVTRQSGAVAAPVLDYTVDYASNPVQINWIDSGLDSALVDGEQIQLTYNTDIAMALAKCAVNDISNCLGTDLGFLHRIDKELVVTEHPTTGEGILVLPAAIATDRAIELACRSSKICDCTKKFSCSCDTLECDWDYGHDALPDGTPILVELRYPDIGEQYEICYHAYHEASDNEPIFPTVPKSWKTAVSLQFAILAAGASQPYIGTSQSSGLKARKEANRTVKSISYGFGDESVTRAFDTSSNAGSGVRKLKLPLITQQLEAAIKKLKPRGHGARRPNKNTKNYGRPTAGRIKSGRHIW